MSKTAECIAAVLHAMDRVPVPSALLALGFTGVLCALALGAAGRSSRVSAVCFGTVVSLLSKVSDPQASSNSTSEAPVLCYSVMQE